MPRHLLKPVRAAALLVALALAGWAETTPAAAPQSPDPVRLRDGVERLYLNTRSLQDTYRDLRLAAGEAVEGSDPELSYIQKATMLVDEANLICYYQWSLLALGPQIADTFRTDTITLRVRDLKRAVKASRHRVMALALYAAYIRSSAAQDAIATAIAQVEGNIYGYASLLELMQPYAHPPNRYNQTID
jgi:hypothetical protein